MAASTAEVEREKQTLEDMIRRQRQQADQMERRYRNALQSLQMEMEQGIQASKAEQLRRHQRELDEIAAQYARQRAEMQEALASQRRRLEEKIRAEDQRIHKRIADLEQQVNARNAKEKQTADLYLDRMRREWHKLYTDRELEPFVRSHANVMDTTEQKLDEIYRKQLYQAASAVAINSSALISTWKTEAVAQLEEWQALYALCENSIRCEDTAQKVAEDQAVDCDGAEMRVSLLQYDPDGFARQRLVLEQDRAKLAQARLLSPEEMRSFLHELEAHRQGTEQIIRHAQLLHRCFVRRLRALRTIEQGMTRRHYQRMGAALAQESILGEIRALFGSRYLNDRVLVVISTPQPESGQQQVRVILLPGTAMDEELQYGRCTEQTAYIMSLLEQQPYRPVGAHCGSPYRNSSGIYQADVVVQHNR